ncbi:MAG: metallophosphoesterase [Desulfobacterales bacterium]|nr:metallophosphoesterase [Desulfobacterales bacterium]
MIIFLLSIFSAAIMVLFTGIILFREYQYYTVLQVGWGVFYFALLILFFWALRHGAWALILGLKKRVGRAAERWELKEKLHLKWGGSGSIDPGRRRFISNSVNVGIVALSGSFVGKGLMSETLTPRVRKTAIPVENLPDDLDGFRIVQISDVHVNELMTRDWVRDVVDGINSLKPDLVVNTGDFADEPVASTRDVVAPFADISAKFGRYFVTGNHEYYHGRVEDWLEELERLGFVVLMNENVTIRRGAGRILLGGVADYRAGAFRLDHLSDPFAAMAGARERDCKILLAHRPESVYKAVEAGFDLQLSGHTHGGQFFPLHYMAALTLPYVSGLYKRENTHLFVNQGTGHIGPPIRFGVPAEISLLTLRRGWG